MKRYVVSEWFDFGGGGDIFSTDDLDEAKRYITKLYEAAPMFVSYSLYDKERNQVIRG